MRVASGIRLREASKSRPKFSFYVLCFDSSFCPFKKLINGVARLTFDSETAVKELSYESLEELHDKYLYIAVTVTEASGKWCVSVQHPLGVDLDIVSIV